MALQPDNIYNDAVFSGKVSFTNELYVPPGSIRNVDIAADANNLLDAGKLEHKHAVRLSTAIGTDVTAIDEVVHIFDGDATLEDVSIVCETAPTGGDKQTEVDVQKWTPSAWVSILSAVEDVDTTYADNVRQSITLSGTPTFVAGDLLRIIVTVSGSTGSQAQGICIVPKFTEDP